MYLNFELKERERPSLACQKTKQNGFSKRQYIVHSTLELFQSVCLLTTIQCRVRPALFGIILLLAIYDLVNYSRPFIKEDVFFFSPHQTPNIRFFSPISLKWTFILKTCSREDGSHIKSVSLVPDL